jgi:hypothetical protein
MNIQAGRRYITRSGLITSPIQLSGPNDFPFVGEVEGRLCFWRSDGYYIGPDMPSAWDLLKPYRPIRASILISLIIVGTILALITCAHSEPLLRPSAGIVLTPNAQGLNLSLESRHLLFEYQNLAEGHNLAGHWVSHTSLALEGVVHVGPHLFFTLGPSYVWRHDRTPFLQTQTNRWSFVAGPGFQYEHFRVRALITPEGFRYTLGVSL